MMLLANLMSVIMFLTLVSTGFAECKDVSGTLICPQQAVRAPSVELKLDLKAGFCEAIYTADKDELGNLKIQFKDLMAEATALRRPYASCRFEGSLVIPKGYQLNRSLELKASIKSQLNAAGDNVTGRLKFGIDQAISRDFKLVEFEQADEASPNLSQSVNMELQAKVPELKTSCAEDSTLNLYMFVESTVNGRGTQATIESMSLPALTLEALSCP